MTTGNRLILYSCPYLSIFVKTLCPQKDTNTFTHTGAEGKLGSAHSMLLFRVCSAMQGFSGSVL